jgi:integral membrane protein
VKPGVLTFYRVMAYVTAVLLILLCLAMVLKYAWPAGTPTQLLGENGTSVIGTAHGFLYLVYLFVAFIATVQLRVSYVRMLLVLLAGTIPFGAFVAERRVTHWHHLRLEGRPIGAQAHDGAENSRSASS